MPLPTAAQQIANKADAEVGSRLSAAVAMQDDYFAEHGRYWQGIETQDAPPENGAPGTPDYSRRPTDQADDWLAVSADEVLPEPPNTRVRVDAYEGTDGHGWVLRMDFRVGGKRYEKAVNVGPETHRSFDWREAVDAVD